MFRRVILLYEYVGQWCRKWLDVSISFPHKQRGLRQSWKLCLNLCSWKWLKPRHNLFISLIPIGLWQLQMLFGLGNMNFKTLLLKKATLSELRMSVSRLFYPFIVDGKKEFLKKLCSKCLVKYMESDEGTNWKR